MGERTTFARALKYAETGSYEGRYAAVRGAVRDHARLLGAYGIASDEWDRLATEAGYEGARWSDGRAQDAVVRFHLGALQEKYGDWRLVAVAWRAGEEIADMVAQKPGLLNSEGLKPVKDYAEQVMMRAREDEDIFDPADDSEALLGTERFSVRRPIQSNGQVSATPADEALRGMLTAMRNRQRRNEMNVGNIEPTGEPDASTE